MSKRIIKLFCESKSREVWYHGNPRPDPLESFKGHRMDRDQMTSIENENVSGPGIYFTDDKGEAAKYARYEGYIYTVALTGNIITEKTTLTEDMIRKLVNWAPQEYMEQIEEEMEDEEEGSYSEYIDEVIQKYTRYGSKNFLPPAIRIYELFYKSAYYDEQGAKEFTDALTYLDLDGIKVRPNMKEGNHVVMWNPKSISIEGIDSYGELYDDY